MSTPYVRTKAKGPSIYYVREGLDGQVQKMVSFADIQQCIYADIVGGSEKVQNNADVIFLWSLSEIQFIIKNPLQSARAVRLKKKISSNKGKQRQFPYRSLASKLDYNRFAVPDVILLWSRTTTEVLLRRASHYAGSFNFGKSIVLLTLLKLTFFLFCIFQYP